MSQSLFNEQTPLVDGSVIPINDQDGGVQEAKSVSEADAMKTKKVRRLQQMAGLTSFSTVVLWGSLLGSKTVDPSLAHYTPHSSCVDIVIVDVLRTLAIFITMVRDTEQSLTLGMHLSTLSILTLFAKPWVYRAWATHPACTSTLVIALFASAIHVYAPYKILSVRNPPEQKLRWQSIKRILRPYFIPTGWRNKILVVITWLVLIFSKVCDIFSPLVLGMIVSRLTHQPPSKVTDLLLIYFALNVAPKIFSEIQDVLYVKVWQRAFSEVADTTFRHVHSLSLEWHLKKKMGNVMRSVDRGMEAADTLMYYAMLFLLPAIGSALAAFIVFVVHFKQAEIAAICFLGFCLYMWITLVVTVWRNRFREEMNSHDNDMHEVATDSMINFETVKYFTNEDFEADRYSKGVQNYQQSSYTSQASISVLNVSQTTVTQLAMLCALLVAANAVYHDEDGFDVGTFVAVQAYVLTIFQPLSFLGTVYSSIMNSLVDLQNLSDLLAEKADVVDLPNAKALATGRGAPMDIAFEKVRFRYESQLATQGIKGISFSVPAGTTTAIVGQTGSGKTTVSRLLFRFYDLISGAIAIGGQNIKDVTQRSLRGAIGIVPQDTCLFNDTIMANIRYGRNDATDEEVYEAARKAQVYDMIERLDDKWNTVVGERGLKLSGGEKQRVAIARCLLKDPPIVVLDEATSALDNKTEREIQNALQCLSGRTTLVVAHRLTTVQNADQIIVMRDGEIAERGTHSQLLANPDSIYSEMWSAQQQAVTSANDSSAATPSIAESERDE